jgi:hypothetical protein
VVYISDEELENLPEEPEQKFVALERIVRERYEIANNNLGHNDSALPLLRRYMSIVLPAAHLYQVRGLADWKRPSTNEDEWGYYNAFLADVDYCTTELRLRNLERQKQHSVALDAATKIKLRHLLKQIRETVDKLEVSVAKKERLYARVAGLESEIDRDRTRYQAVAALMIEACDDTGEAVKRLEPVVRLIERVGAAIGIARRAEEAQPQLPPPKGRKQIDHVPDKIFPKQDGSRFDRQLDDEIPF